MNIQQKLNQLENLEAYELMTKDEFKEFISNVANGSHTFGSMVSYTDCRMNVKGNPFRDRVKKLSKWSFACNTSSKVKGNSTRAKNDIGGEYKPQESYVSGEGVNFTLCEKKDDPTKMYLRVYTNAGEGKSIFTEYYVDDVKATEFEVEQIKGFIVKKSKGSNNLGVKGDDAHGVFNVGLDSIKYINIDGRKIKIVV